MKLNEFENDWYKKIQNELLKSFPGHFIEGKEFEVFKLPGTPLLKGTELFGRYEIIDMEGKPILSTDNLNKLKYILYANLNHPKSIKIPLKDNEIKDAVKEYELHLDEIVKMIKSDFISHFPESDKHIASTNRIFKLLNLQRH